MIYEFCHQEQKYMAHWIFMKCSKLSYDINWIKSIIIAVDLKYCPVSNKNKMLQCFLSRKSSLLRECLISLRATCFNRVNRSSTMRFHPRGRSRKFMKKKAQNVTSARIDRGLNSSKNILFISRSISNVSTVMENGIRGKKWIATNCEITLEARR